MNPNMNYHIKRCTAPSGRHYAEIYSIADGDRKLVHKTARHDDIEDALDEARNWVEFTNTRATAVYGAEAVPAA